MTNEEMVARVREWKRLAEAPAETVLMTPDEKAAFQSAKARQEAKDDEARAGDTPQASLPLDEAA